MKPNYVIMRKGSSIDYLTMDFTEFRKSFKGPVESLYPAYQDALTSGIEEWEKQNPNASILRVGIVTTAGAIMGAAYTCGLLIHRKPV